jgi:hypothetical protein
MCLVVWHSSEHCSSNNEQAELAQHNQAKAHASGRLHWPQLLVMHLAVRRSRQHCAAAQCQQHQITREGASNSC